jgi:uncharacterized damage-inducible protein DinB
MLNRRGEMVDDNQSLAVIFDGWDGYNTSLVHAVEPLTVEQVRWRPEPKLRSVGQVASHIAFGRIDWFVCMPAPGSAVLKARASEFGGQAAAAEDPGTILSWLIDTWQMIADTLSQWTVSDLARTYRHEYYGQVYAVSFQWTIWRILTHDVHHGGELALMLGLQGLEVPELGDLFGHLTEPPLA